MPDGVALAACASADDALAVLDGVTDRRRAAVLPRAALDDQARVLLRGADVECITTLDGGGLDAARWLGSALAANAGWTEVGAGSPAAAGTPAPGDVVGWYELRIGATLTTDRPITRLHGTDRYIASFNLL